MWMALFVSGVLIEYILFMKFPALLMAQLHVQQCELVATRKTVVIYENDYLESVSLRLGNKRQETSLMTRIVKQQDLWTIWIHRECTS